MSRIQIGLIILLGLLLAACAGNEVPSTEALDQTGGDVDTASGGSPERGEELFMTGGASGIPCSACHTLDGEKLVGPSLRGIGFDAAERVPGQSAEEYLRESIIQPSAYQVEGYSATMNATYGDTLSEQDIDDLVAFLLTQ